MVVGIIAVLIAILLPVVTRARESAVRLKCASNLHQIGAALRTYVNDFRSLPVRVDPLDQTNPHVFKYQQNPEDISGVMQKYAGSRDVYYCPGNHQDKDGSNCWPLESGTIAVTYQFPFMLKRELWWADYPDYHRMGAGVILGTDYCGTDDATIHVLAWNHTVSSDGSPKGMNMLFGDGHVVWRVPSQGWTRWGSSAAGISWYWAED